MQSENKTYSAADIERYHAGQMPAHEMHALEKAALEDPFLADALEGYQFTATPAADLQSIRERLEGKKEKRRTLFPQWLKVAAILLVLAGGTWLTLSQLNPSNDSLAVKKENQPEADHLKRADSTSFRNEMVSTEQPGNTVQAKTISKPANKPKASKPSGNAMASRKSREKQVEETAVAANPVVASTDLKASSVNNDSILAGAIARNDKNFANRESARVRGNEARNLDLRNRSMPMPENNNQVRNQDGYYRNPPDTVALNDMSVERKSIADTNINIVMQPARDELAEVVVLGNSRKAKEGMMQRVVVDSLEPAEGWASFDDYIASNIKEPEEIKFKKQSGGEVQLSFDVNRKGEPVNIAVVKSLCTKCDEEAIRLLKEGPKWKRNKNGKGRLTIRF